MTSTSEETHSTALSYYTRPTHTRVVGLLWLLVPVCSFTLFIILYGVLRYYLALQMTEHGGRSTLLFINMTNSVFMLLGLVCFIGFLVGLPVGIIYLLKRQKYVGAPLDARSGEKYGEIPQELKGWNWGAAGLGLVWGLYHGVWISLLGLIPYVHLIWWIVMGSKGNEWAWRAEKWESVDVFLSAQKRWKVWGIAFFVLQVLSFLLLLFALLGR